jgi:argininosuccinate lyase
VRFDKERARAALEDGATAATDVAEALAQAGVPFRTAYKLTGALVRKCMEAGVPLSRAPLQLARSVDPRFTSEILGAADAAAAVAGKKNAGGTGAASIDAQIAALHAAAAETRSRAERIPRLDRLLAELKEAPL